MVKNVIFDYMGVLADVDYKKLLSKISLNEKFKAIRIITALKLHPTFKYSFDQYQLGALNKNDLYEIAHKIYPKSAEIIPTLLNLLPNCLKENEAVVSLAKKLHNDGYKIILISNSIPEMQEKIQNSSLVEFFDGFVMSHLVGMMKPDKNIFDFACKTYEIDPKETIFIDDTPENLIGAKNAKLETMHCKKPNILATELTDFIYNRNQPESN